jgi:hypothetical protein
VSIVPKKSHDTLAKLWYHGAPGVLDMAGNFQHSLTWSTRYFDYGRSIAFKSLILFDHLAYP